MLQTLLGRTKSEEEMSDEQPQYVSKHPYILVNTIAHAVSTEVQKKKDDYRIITIYQFLVVFVLSMFQGQEF